MRANDYCDMVIGAHTVLRQPYTDEVYTLNSVREIHLSDVRPLAADLGFEVSIAERGDETYPHEYYFMYNGWKFFSIHKEEEEDDE